MTVDAFMMMTDNPCDFRVVVDLGEDSLTNGAVLLHLPALIQGQRAGFLQKPDGKPDLSNVMDQTRQMYQSLILFWEAHTLGDVT